MLDTTGDTSRDETRRDETGGSAQRSSFPLALLWGAWALALAALAQPVAALVSAVHVLTGGLDDRYFQDYSYAGNGDETITIRTDVTFWERWDVVTSAVQFDRVLLPSAAIAVVLAGLHLVGRGRWRPPSALRLVAAATGALTAVTALANTLVMLAGTQRTQDEQYGSYGWPSPFANLAIPVATSAAVAVFAAVAVVVLLGPAAPAPAPAREVPPAPPLEPAGGTGAPDDPANQTDADTGPGSDTGTSSSGADPDPDPAVPSREELEFPRPNEEDYAWYRRPTS